MKKTFIITLSLLLLNACADDAPTKKTATNKQDFATAIKDKMPIPKKNDDTITRAESLALQPDSDFQIKIPQPINSQQILQNIPNRFAQNNKISDALNADGQYIPNPAQEQALAQTRQRLLQTTNRIQDKNTALALQQQIQNTSILGKAPAVKSDLRADVEWQYPNEGLKIPGQVDKKDPNKIYQATESLDKPLNEEPDIFNNNAKALGTQILLGKNPNILSNNSLQNNNKQILTQSVSQKLPNATKQKAVSLTSPIALLLPLTGARQQLGQDFRDAALLSLSQFAKNTNNPNIAQIFPIDTKGTEIGAKQAMQSAIDLGAKIIIGPVFYNEAQAVAQMVVGKDIMVVSFTNTTDAARENIFPFGYYPEEQLMTLFQYLQENNFNRLSIVMPKSEFGTLIYRHAQKLASQYNIQLVKPLEYDDKTNIAQQINQYTNYEARKKRSIKGLRAIKPEFDAVLIADSDYNRVRNIIKQLHIVDVSAPSVPVFGLQVLDNFEEFAGDENTNNFNIITADIDGRKTFQDLFMQSFKRIPDRRATLSFDAVSLAIASGFNKKTASPLEFITQSDQGFIGVDGKILFNPNGWVNRQYHIYTLNDNEIMKIF